MWLLLLRLLSGVRVPRILPTGQKDFPAVNRRRLPPLALELLVNAAAPAVVEACTSLNMITSDLPISASSVLLFRPHSLPRLIVMLERRATQQPLPSSMPCQLARKAVLAPMSSVAPWYRHTVTRFSQYPSAPPSVTCTNLLDTIQPAGNAIRTPPTSHVYGCVIARRPRRSHRCQPAGVTSLNAV